MENHNGQDFAAKSASATYSPEDDIEIGGQDDVADNAFISEKIGTKKDRADMMRMGKNPELKVCIILEDQRARD
jgi:hypothetical protein